MIEKISETETEEVIRESFHNGSVITKYYSKITVRNQNPYFSNYYVNYSDRVLNRADGPAVIAYKNNVRQYEEWYKNGSLHRTDGPAIIYYNSNGSPSKAKWVMNDININVDVGKWCRKVGITPDFRKWGDDERLMFKLMFSETNGE